VKPRARAFYTKENMSYIPRVELAKELKIELTYEKDHPHEIIPDAFWTKIVSEYDANKHQFIKNHQCPVLDHILRCDHLECSPSYCPPCPTPVVCEPCSPFKCDPVSVPEPSGFILVSIALVVIAIVVSFKRGYL
jgi:hypothetical protein